MLNRIITFSKAQISAFIGAVADYLIMIFLTEVFNIHYTISIAIGGVIGSIINFSLNKTWAFKMKDTRYKNSGKIQLLKFVIVVVNSIVMKSAGTYAITKFVGIDYKISRLITDFIVSIAFNYTLQKYWVFKKRTIVESKAENSLSHS